MQSENVRVESDSHFFIQITTKPHTPRRGKATWLPLMQQQPKHLRFNQIPNTCETRASHSISWHFRRRRIVPCTAEPIAIRIHLSRGLFLVYLKWRTKTTFFVSEIKEKWIPQDEMKPHDPQWADTKIYRLQPKYLKWRAMLSFTSKSRETRILLSREQITR